MAETVTVIVSKCVSNVPANENRVYGDRLVDKTFDGKDVDGEARKLAESNLANQRAVILRPNYNEVDEHGNRYFREWRSFNGEPLREVKFSY